MKDRFWDAVDNLRRRHEEALPTLHPVLREKVTLLLARLGGRFGVWEGYRDHHAQSVAYAKGYSNAAPGQSPHNHTLEDGTPCSLAADLVLDPRYVTVRANRSSPSWPDLWDDETPEAVQAWADLDREARALGLVRVMIGRGKRRRPDLPHVELPDWRALRGA